ncbi:MAG: addiction module protein [Nitrosospira sp.]
MRILSKEDVKTLTMDQKLELMDLFLSESLGQDQIPVSPEVEYEIKSRLKTFPQDKAASVAWEEAKRQLMP